MQIDPRQFAPKQKNNYVKKVLAQAHTFAAQIPHGEAVFKPFSELLRFIVESNYCGGCHDTSAVLHMLLTETGIPSTLCIGEVGSGPFFFDHSWIDVDGLIFDAAVCMPHPSGAAVSGPIFGSIDLESGLASSLRYGEESGEGLGLDAQPALMMDLQAYSDTQPELNIWILVVGIAARCGHQNPTFQGFQDRYGAVRRTLRTTN